MTAPALLPPRAALLAGPTVLAFFAGGYFAGPRLTALLVAAVTLGWLALASDAPVPRGRTGRVAVAALALLAGWTALSITWSPLPADARGDAERVLLYAVAFAAAAAAWRARPAARAVEPLLALGTVVVVGYGLAGRLLPAVVDERINPGAAGRLDQPLTYWNAVGALAAMGLVLCARLAGDRTRPVALRAAAAAGAPVLGLGLYLSFSRGALVALAGGLALLVVLAPSWPQVRAILIALEAAAIACMAGALAPAVRALEGGDRETEGAVVLLALLGAMALAAILTASTARAESQRRAATGPVPIPRLGVPAVLALAAAALIIPVVAGRDESTPTGASSARFATLGSNRPAYWRVALRTAADHPLHGAGASGFAAAWVEHRRIRERVHDAHSLPLETAAELGLIGLLLLGAFVLAVGRAGMTLETTDPVLAAGPLAALGTWALHACVDWDWEMPALTLVALVLAGLVVARADA